MSDTEIIRNRTAIKRSDLSRPIRLALESGLINCQTSVFDYGCGRGDDLRNLQAFGINCSGWDPKFRPSEIIRPADIVNLGYVINVIENEKERIAAIRKAWSLTRKLLIVSCLTSTRFSPRRQLEFPS